MITTIKTVRAHYKALYWKSRMEKADQNMRKALDVLSAEGSGKHETEYGFFTVAENNAYPADRIKALLTPEQRAQCLESKWSNTRARVLFPEVYESVKERKGYKVSI